MKYTIIVRNNGISREYETDVYPISNNALLAYADYPGDVVQVYDTRRAGEQGDPGKLVAMLGYTAEDGGQWYRALC